MLSHMFYICRIDERTSRCWASLPPGGIDRKRPGGVSGYLIQNGNTVIEVVEGTQENILTLLTAIRHDRQVSEVEVLELSPIGGARFNGWHARMIGDAAQVAAA